jgi:signal peptidase I
VSPGIPKPKSALGGLVELVVIVALAIGLALGIQAVVVKPFQIPSGSMIPTLEIGQRVLVNRFSHQLGGDPEIGDITVFHPPKQQSCTVDKEPGQVCPSPGEEMGDNNFIKRVVAGPGDRLRIVDGNPIVNGEPIEQDWEMRPCGPGGQGCEFDEEVTIPDDHYFMMGDNRGHSHDSRFWGPVPRDWIIGQAFATYWPPDQIGLF